MRGADAGPWRLTATRGQCGAKRLLHFAAAAAPHHLAGAKATPLPPGIITDEITCVNILTSCDSRYAVIRRCPWVCAVIVTHLVTQPLTPCHVITSNR